MITINTEKTVIITLTGEDADAFADMLAYERHCYGIAARLYEELP